MPPSFDRADASGDDSHRLPPVAEEGLKLSELEKVALVRNPALARTAADLRAAEGDWLQTGLYPNPVVGLGQQQTGSRGLAEQDGVAFRQEFVTGHKRQLSRAVGQQQVARARQDLMAQQLRILTDVRIEFYSLLVAQEQLTVARQLVDIAKENVRFAQEQNKGDEIGENDVVEAQGEQYAAEIGAFRAEMRVRMTRQRLAAVTGMATLPPVPVAGDLRQLPLERTWNDTLARLQQQSPEVAGALADQEAARWSVERARAQAVPNVTFDGLVNWRDNGIGGRPDGAFQFSVPVPIWDRNQGGRQSASQEFIAAQRAVQQLELSLQYRLAEVFENYATARRQVIKYRDQILPTSRKSLELTRQGYRVGKVDYNDLLTSQRSYARANIDYLEALEELWSAEIRIEGLLLSRSLESKSE